MINVTIVRASTQPESMRSALDFFLASASRFDVLIALRFDVLLLQPITAWECAHHSRAQLSFGSRCEPLQWRQWNCTAV